MPLHHYLPATFLSRFSLDEKEPDRRNRIIYIGNKENKKVYPIRVGKAGAINNLYTVIDQNTNPQIIDNLWEGYESNLNSAISDLVNARLDAKTWIRVLVPFVACMLVRGPDFHERISRRLKSLGFDESSPHLTKTRTNRNRLMEIQRLLGPVTVAKWVVVQKTGKEHLITNDLGFCRFFHPESNEYGMAIPLGQKHILMVIPRTNGEILKFNSGEWFPTIQYAKLPLDNHIDLNYTMASSAQRFLFCPNEKSAEKYIKDITDSQEPIEPAEIGFIWGIEAMAHEFTWHRLAIALEDHSSIQNEFPLEWEKLTQGWYPHVILPTNLVDFPSALYRKGNSIYAHFYDPKIYLILSSTLEYQRMGLFKEVLKESSKGLRQSKNKELTTRFHLIRSDAFIELNKISLALAELEKILKLNPKNLNARIKKAAILIFEDQLDHAYNEIEYILKIDPKSGPALVQLGKYYLNCKKMDLAIQETIKAISLLPKSSLLGGAHFIRGMAYLDKGNNKAAIEDFNSAIELVDDKESLPICYFNRAIAYIELLDEEKINIGFKKTCNHDKNFKQKFPFQDSSDKEFNHFNQIINDLSYCIENQCPKELLLLARETRGQLYFSSDDLDLALNDFVEAERLETNNPKYPYFLGDIFLHKGYFKKAIKQYEKAIKLNPNLGEAYSNIGIAYFLLGNLTKAEPNFKRAISLFKDTTNAGTPQRYLAQIYLSKQEFDLAKAFIYKAEIDEPDSRNNYFIRALISMYEGDYRCALLKLDVFGSEKFYNNFAELLKSIPYAILGNVKEAKNNFDSNISQIQLFNKKIFSFHLENIIKSKQKNETLLAFLSDLTKNNDIDIQ